MTFVAGDDVRPGPAAEALLRREAHGETLGVQLEVQIGVQVGRRVIPALDRSRFVVRPGIPMRSMPPARGRRERNERRRRVARFGINPLNL